MSNLHYFHPDWIELSDETLETDVCIYGGTSGGIAAAVTVARVGLRVVILQPGLHVGGMTTGGLGWTDFGRKHVIGGLSRSFYQEVGRHYGLEEEWVFEPHVAAAVYSRWISTCGFYDGPAAAPLRWKTRVTTPLNFALLTLSAISK